MEASIQTLTQLHSAQCLHGVSLEESVAVSLEGNWIIKEETVSAIQCCIVVISAMEQIILVTNTHQLIHIRGGRGHEVNTWTEDILFIEDALGERGSVHEAVTQE